MNRREFLRLMAFTALSTKITSGNSEASRFDLSVVRGSSPGLITRTAIDALGGMRRFISRGDIVVIKPNIAFDRLPEHAATTNPDVVREVVRMCFEAGARKVKVFDRTVNDPRRCYMQSGIYDAARNEGAHVEYIDERRFVEMQINGYALKRWLLYKDVFEADKFINIPIAKHHSLAGLTMSMKNLMGIMGGLRRSIHQRLDESLVDLAGFVKPTLTILDAVRILTANGPQGGDLRDVKVLNTVVAGIDMVAVDSFGATLFGMKGSDLGYVRIADRLGIGTMDLTKLNIKRIEI